MNPSDARLCPGVQQSNIGPAVQKSGGGTVCHSVTQQEQQFEKMCMTDFSRGESTPLAYTLPNH